MENNGYLSQKKRGLKRKLELVKLLGGECSRCGYSKNISGLDFHHTCEESKSFGLDMRRLSNNKMSVILAEVEKCVLLCANCHREIHHPDLNFDNLDEIISGVDESVLFDKKVCKPKCVDCGGEVDYGVKRCFNCHSFYQRKFKRPEYSELIINIKKIGYVGTGRKYGVSDNAIRKWVKFYEKK